MRHKVFVVVTDNYKDFFQRWFMRTMKDDFDVRTIDLPCQQSDYDSDDYIRLMEDILYIHLDIITRHQGEIVSIFDADLQFFRPCEPILMDTIKDKDIAFVWTGYPVHNKLILDTMSRDEARKPGTHFLNGGVMTIRCNENTQRFAQLVVDSNWRKLSLYSQSAAQNVCVQHADWLKWTLFPPTVHEMYTPWPKGESIAIHHTTHTVPVPGKTSMELKEEQMRQVRAKVIGMV